MRYITSLLEKYDSSVLWKVWNLQLFTSTPLIWIIKTIWEKEWFIYESVASIINHECAEVSFLGGGGCWQTHILINFN